MESFTASGRICQHNNGTSAIFYCDSSKQYCLHNEGSNDKVRDGRYQAGDPLSYISRSKCYMVGVSVFGIDGQIRDTFILNAPAVMLITFITKEQPTMADDK